MKSTVISCDRCGAQQTIIGVNIHNPTIKKGNITMSGALGTSRLPEGDPGRCEECAEGLTETVTKVVNAFMAPRPAPRVRTPKVKVPEELLVKEGEKAPAPEARN